MRARVVSSIALSLVLHAGGLVALSLVGARSLASPGESPQVGVVQGLELADTGLAVLVPLAVLPTPEPLPTPEIQPEPEPEVMPPKPEVELEVPLGIEDGAERSEVWKGAKEATEHLAPKSKIDQAARAIDPRAGAAEAGPASAGDGERAAQEVVPQPPQPEVSKSAPAEQTVPAPEPQPKPVQELEKQDQPQQVEPEQLNPQQSEPEQLKPQSPPAPEPEGASEVELPRPQDAPVQPEPPQPEPEQLKQQQEKPEQPQEQQLRPVQPETAPAQSADTSTAAAPPVTPVPPQPADAPSAKASAPQAEPGLRADEESPAASVVGSLVFKPGEPLAGKGLRVWTVTPKYAVTTRYLARPKNAVVLITFGRDGKVRKAVFKERTGYEDVDKPLLEAVYRWTARGEALSSLPADKPDAGVTYSIKFLMETY
ncbi:MAG TPA: hypothetical protein VD997_16100 [Phycisphaerales bacterium]|nr:hypothetical protein [Phycisphaerales bacterium]